jgi:dimethylhistidine N-methyltransferase
MNDQNVIMETITRPLSKGEEIQLFAKEVSNGFQQTLKRIPSRYFYDDKGSELFTQITELEEYYLTNSEAEILTERAREIAQIFHDNFSEPMVRIIELGAGDSDKPLSIIRETCNLFPQVSYHAIDISDAALENQALRTSQEFSALEFTAIHGEYISGLKHLRDSQMQNIVMFLGSNIGNFFSPDEISFLKDLRKNMNAGDWLIIGFDLKKDIDTLMNAYNDSKGITSEFNLNLLTRMNRELGADFNITNFQHYPLYNPGAGRMESYIISKCAQEVTIQALHQTFSFEAFEPILTEYSCKYDINLIERLAEQSDFQMFTYFTDEQEYFATCLWKAV